MYHFFILVHHGRLQVVGIDWREALLVRLCLRPDVLCECLEDAQRKLDTRKGCSWIRHVLSVFKVLVDDSLEFGTG